MTGSAYDEHRLRTRAIRVVVNGVMLSHGTSIEEYYDPRTDSTIIEIIDKERDFSMSKDKKKSPKVKDESLSDSPDVKLPDEAVETAKSATKSDTKRAAKRRLRTKGGFVTVNRMYTADGEIVSEEHTEDPIKVMKSAEGVELGEVGYNSSMTINLGNYESVKVGVHCSLPCYAEERHEAFTAAKTLTDAKLMEEVDSVKEYRDKKRKGK